MRFSSLNVRRSCAVALLFNLTLASVSVHAQRIGDAGPAVPVEKLCLYNRAPLSFDPAINIATGTRHTQVTAWQRQKGGDAEVMLNLDGKGTPLDLVVASPSQFGISLIFNVGVGRDGTEVTYERIVSIGLNGTPTAILAGNLDRDTDTDLIVNLETKIAVLLNDGLGNFTRAPDLTPSPTNLRFVPVAIADLDGDTDLDVVAVDNIAKMHSFVNSSSASFARGPTWETGIWAPKALRAFYADGDGLLDLVLTNGGSGLFPISPVSVFRNLTTPGGPLNFNVPGDQYHYADNSFGVATGDFNQDGKADVMPLLDLPQSVLPLLNSGNGGMTYGTPTSLGARGTAIARADLDIDRKLDLLTANGDAGNISVLRGDGTGGFAPVRIYPAANGAKALATADLDRDGDLDAVVANTTTGLSLLKNKSITVYCRK